MKFYKIEAAVDWKQISSENSNKPKSKSIDYNDRDTIRQMIEDFNEKYLYIYR